jgi:hypothetical protein
MKKRFQIPKLDFRAAFKPDSIDAEKRTVELVFSTGARVLRSSFWEGKYYEELSMEGGAVRMERLNKGAPLLDSHNARSLASQMGVVERAWIEAGEGKALVRFSKNNEAADKVWRDVVDGIIRNVSVGYVTHKFEQVEGGDSEIPVFRAVDWEPHELSLVPIPADMSSGVRSQEQETFECEFITTRNFSKGDKMTEAELKAKQEREAKEALEKRELEIAAAKKEATELAQKRSVEILSACRKAGIEDAKFAEELVASDVSLDAARAKIIDKVAERAPAINGNNPAITIQRDGVVTMKRGIENALLHRFDGSHKLEEGKDYVGMSLRELARECLQGMGVNTRGMSVNKIAELAFTRGMHSTSDFAEILANVANKTLRKAYEEAPATYQPLVREVENADFKQISRTQLGDFPAFEKIAELQEYKAGTTSEAAEKYQIETYGKKIGLSRQTIINDDMDAFTRLPFMAGVAARNLIANTVWNIFLANANMADGNALFSAAHGNLVTTGSAAIKDGLTLMRTLMKKQTGLDGQLLNILPNYLIVGAERETEAENVVSGLVVPNTVNDVNAFARTLQIISEPRLGAVPYYLSARPGMIDMIELAYLQGERGVYLETRQGFDVDGMEMKARLDFAAKAIDWRGLVKNNGVA